MTGAVLSAKHWLGNKISRCEKVAKHFQQGENYEGIQINMYKNKISLNVKQFTYRYSYQRPWWVSTEMISVQLTKLCSTDHSPLFVHDKPLITTKKDLHMSALCNKEQCLVQMPE